jgi:hypothetical protein
VLHQDERGLRVLFEERAEGVGRHDHHLDGRQRHGTSRPRPAVDGRQLAEDVAGADDLEHDLAFVEGDGDLELTCAHEHHVMDVIAFEEQDRLRRVLPAPPELEQLHSVIWRETIEERGEWHGGTNFL